MYPHAFESRSPGNFLCWCSLLEYVRLMKVELARAEVPEDEWEVLIWYGKIWWKEVMNITPTIRKIRRPWTGLSVLTRTWARLNIRSRLRVHTLTRNRKNSSILASESATPPPPLRRR